MLYLDGEHTVFTIIEFFAVDMEKNNANEVDETKTSNSDCGGWVEAWQMVEVQNAWNW